MLNSVLPAGGLTAGPLLLCTLCALLCGLVSAFLYAFRNIYTKGFAVTLCFLPLIVEAVILLVNGNLGTGVAVMGAFSLVRFRSVPGSAREICAVFLAMALGLACGTGYLMLALVLLVLGGGGMALLSVCGLFTPASNERELRVTIPENMDYETLFDDLFARYAKAAKLVKVRLVSMGTLYELTYHVQLTGDVPPKALLDEMRCRNGNLNLSCGPVAVAHDEL